ncbi:VirB4 family type IV secretion system protein [Bacillus inaquosorum]|uniref:VirB4 family type IV secretion system protein n=1 Tax=Bacillus inaquosorum TaxID=483913 RepID=UPI003D1BE6C4
MSLLKLFKPKKKPNEKETEVNEIKGLIDREVMDSIYPFVFETNRDHIAAGGNYIKPYVILSYPNQPIGNWLSPLKRLKGNVTISQHLEPANGEALNHYYNETIKNKEAELLRTLDHMRSEKIKKEIQSARKQLNESLDEKSTFMYLYTYILLQAKSETELNSLEEALNRVLIKTNLKAIVPHRKIDDAFWSCLPIGLNKLPEYTYSMTNSVSASSFMPFDDNEICDITETSTIEGKNKDTNSYIAVDYLNRKRTLNRNRIVLGTSGGGKSTFIGKTMLQNVAEGSSNVYNIDPEAESSKLFLSLGGTVIDLSSSSTVRLNPFEIQSVYLDSDDDDVIKHTDRQLTDEEVDNLIKQKVQRLKGIHRAIMPEMNRVQLSIISKETMGLYETFRKVKNIGKMSPTDFPILEDLYNALKRLENTDIKKFKLVEEYCFILEDMVYGSSTILNGHTNVDLSSKLISFNLKPLQTETDMQSVVYLNTFGFLWDMITSNKAVSDLLFCDEFHFLLKNEDSADFFLQAYKRFRKYNAGVNVTTQQIGDLLKSSSDGDELIGAAILGNSYTKVFFGMEDMEVETIKTKLKINLSKKEEDFLKSKRQGEALFMYGKKRAEMKVNLTLEELRIFNPDRYREITGEDPKIVPDWSSKVYLSQSELLQLSSEFDRRGHAV